MALGDIFIHSSSMRSHIFVSGNYYHLYNRGVDRRNIFNDDDDRRRFLRAMKALNNSARKPDTNLSIDPIERSPYIRIIAYCLMDNHYHLLVQQISDVGISRFMQRFMNSYTKYFNIRHSRKGRLLEATFHSVPVESDEQLIHLSRYIHLNPLKFVEPRWKTGIRSPRTCATYLRSYRWSSFANYLGLEPDAACDKTTLINILGSDDDYIRFIEEAVYK